MALHEVWAGTHALLPADRAERAPRLARLDGRGLRPLRRFRGEAPETDARIALFAGEKNLCFLPEAQQRTFDWLERHQPGRHRLVQMSEHGHLCPFLGKNAADEVAPKMLEWLEA